MENNIVIPILIIYLLIGLAMTMAISKWTWNGLALRGKFFVIPGTLILGPAAMVMLILVGTSGVALAGLVLLWWFVVGYDDDTEDDPPSTYKVPGEYE